MPFKNLEPTVMNPEGSSLRKAMWKMIRGVPDRRPENPIENIPVMLPEDRSQDYFIWLGHSTVFIQLAGIRLFIDPVFSQTASPVSFAGPHAFPYRHPITLDLFSGIDLVMITHDHYDHLDKKAIKQLRTQGCDFITPRGVKNLLTKWGVDDEQVTELDWGQEYQYRSIQIKCLPARHFSGRGIVNRNSTQWASYSLKSELKSLFHSGDSGYGAHFKSIGKNEGPFDLAFVECGQYNENWPQIHMMPEQSVQASLDLMANVMIPIHWSKFALSLHPWEEPLRRAKSASRPLNQTVLSPRIGEIIPMDVH